jgi:hypothetical protein
VLHFCVLPLSLCANEFLELDKDNIGRVLVLIGNSFGCVFMVVSNLVGKLWGLRENMLCFCGLQLN